MIRKRWTGMIASLAMVAMGLCACKSETPQTATENLGKETEAASLQPEEMTKPQATAEPKKAEKTNAPAGQETAMPENKESKAVKDMQKMQPILETIALYLWEGNSYEPENDDCYYELCLMLGNNVAPEEYPDQCKSNDADIEIQAGAFEEIVMAAFGSHPELKDIPKDYQDCIEYKKESNIYRIPGTDKADVTGTIGEVKQQQDSYQVQLRLTAEGEEGENQTYLFTLHKNNEGGRYPYQVEEVKKA